MYLAKHNLLDSRFARVAVGLSLAAASYYLIERPFLRLKERFGSISTDRRDVDFSGANRRLKLLDNIVS
jgi:peptidoglycan/LPS O-acetylase OafA/YrhL